MSVIFPGNYVAHLNAYRDQGVFALPSVEFYQIRGAAIVTADQTGGGTLALEILSPDLRQDDKPRLDKPFAIPAGASVYRTAVNVSNLSSTSGATITVGGPSTAGVLATLTADTDGVFAAEGASNEFAFDTALTKEVSEVLVTAANNSDLTIVDADSTAAIIVEVDYYVDAPAPTYEDVPLPFKVEAGQGY